MWQQGRVRTAEETDVWKGWERDTKKEMTEGMQSQQDGHTRYTQKKGGDKRKKWVEGLWCKRNHSP